MAKKSILPQVNNAEGLKRTGAKVKIVNGVAQVQSFGHVSMSSPNLAANMAAVQAGELLPAINKAPSFTGGLWNNLSKTWSGRVIQRGVAMDYGYSWVNKEKGFQFLGGAFEGVGKDNWGKLRSNLGATSNLGAAGRLGFRALPMVLAGYNVLSGLSEGGIAGGARAVVENAMWGVGWEAAMSALGPIGVGAVVIGGVAALAVKKIGTAANKYAGGLRRLEVGGPLGFSDPFGTVATVRQRSLMALQNTHLNARMALGNEALLMHS